MAAVASIIIDADEKGSVDATNRLTASIDNLNASINRVGVKSKQVHESMTKDHQRAQQSAQLLASTMGIQLPRALESVLAKTPGVSQALNAAFAATVIVTFAREVLQLVDNLTGYSEQLAKIQAQNAALISSVSAANKVLIGPQTLKQTNVEILATQKHIEDLNQQLGLTGGSWDAVTRGLTRYNNEQSTLVEDLDKAKAKLNDLTGEQAKLVAQQRITDPVEIMKLQDQARLVQLHGIQQITEATRLQRNEIVANAKATAENALVTQAKINANAADGVEKRKQYMQSENDETRALAQQALLTYVKGTAAINETEQDQVDELQIKLDRKLISIQTFNERRRSLEVIAANQRKEIERQATEETVKLEEQASIGSLPTWQRAYAQIAADAQDGLRKIQRDLDDTKITSEQAAVQSAAVWQVSFNKMRDQLAGDLEGLFDDITSGNIGKRFQKMFKDLVFQMIATWILGVGQMRSASSGAMGGGAGGLLGSLFGLGGGSAPGGTPPFLGGGSSSTGLFGGIAKFFGGGGGSGSSSGGGAGLPVFSNSDLGRGDIFGLGLSAGQGITPANVLPSGSGPKAGGILGSLGGGLNGLFGLATLGGGALLGSKNTILKSIGGLLLGGGIGAGISSAIVGTSLGALLGPIGAFLGPIGALAGFLIPLIGGLFGEHKGDKARKQVMEPLIAQIKLIKDSYDVFQTDYNSGVGALEKLRSDSISSLRSIGGRQVKGNTASTNRLVDDAEAYMKTTEAERARRAQLNFGPAQFHSGGMVTSDLLSRSPGIPGARAFHAGGEVNANLLVGEGVLTTTGMRSVGGPDGLRRLNGGGSAAAPVVNINALDAKSVREWLRGGGLKEIAMEWRNALLTGAIS